MTKEYQGSSLIGVNMMRKLNVSICGLFSLMLISITAIAKERYFPDAEQQFPANVYWGDTHLHTNLSVDAYLSNTLLGPDMAYRFARGDSITLANGEQFQIRRPLDFLVVADHAFNMGVMQAVTAGDTRLLDKAIAEQWLKGLKEVDKTAKTDPDKAAKRKFQMYRKWGWGSAVGNKEFRHSVWEKVTATADQYNDAGKFTAFIGFEWTPKWNLESSSMAHRVVIFEDSAEKADHIIPFSMFDSTDPEDLWDFLQRYQDKTNGDVLAIPHNSNLSQGSMFALHDGKGRPLTRSYAQTRSRWEPLLEVTQIKGDSETHPLLSPQDDFADYERWMWTESDQDRTYEYARSALKLGLQQERELDVNPFKFGMIGSTDSHNSLATVEENDLIKLFGNKLPTADSVLKQITAYRTLGPTLTHGWQFSGSGYAALWATENTREALFAAMKRKETYATTGPRMVVRFFGGWDYRKGDALQTNLVLLGYKKGVPMGGDLAIAPADKAPNFLIQAVKDPDGANLDRIQVIKGWLDKNGDTHEKVYNVALSDNRRAAKSGKVQPVGNSVNVEEASYSNSIGDPELVVVWEDPDFNRNESAFYYVRVLEIPTPRWTAYAAKSYGLDLPKDIPMVTQERAYTSPIWYSPSALKE